MMLSIVSATSALGTTLTKTLRLGGVLLLVWAMATAPRALAQDLPDVPPQAGSAITVTNANDSGAGSLRQAIADINADGTIDFAASLSGQTITLASELSISKGLTIDGASLANPITVSGNDLVRVFNISGTGTVNLTHLVIADGAADNGAGIAMSTGTPSVTLERVTLRENVAAFDAGALRVAVGTAVVNNSAFVQNEASTIGGAIYVIGGSLELNNSTVSGNTATQGAVFVETGTSATLNNVTLANNTGAGVSTLGNRGGTLTLNNTLATGTGASLCLSVDGGTTTQTNSLISDGTCSPTYSTDPNLSVLADNGGATPTHLLNFPSDAIDNGDAAICAALPGGDQDQRGTARVGTCDIGAVEFTGARPSSVSPTSGPASTATAVTLTGTGFTGATGVTFGGTAGTSFTVVSTTEITVTTPAGSAGAVDVVVQHPGGTGTLASGYTFVDNGSIGDFVWNDLNGDGTQDAGEPGLSGVRVYIDANSNGDFDGEETNDVTDGNGAYDLTGLAPGTYSVRVDPSTVPTGFVLTGGTVPTSVTLAAGQDVNTADFGYQAQTDLTITNTNGATSTIPGTQVTYTIVATNTGAAADPSVGVATTLPATLTGVTYTSVASGGATGNTAAGTGALAETLNLPAGASVTYTVTGTVAASATGTLAVTATLTPSIGDTNAANNTATDTDTLTPRADLEPLTFTDSADPVIVGENVTYTITVQNNGPSDATGVTFDLTLDGATISDIAIGDIASGGTGQGTVTTTINSVATLTASATVSATTTLTNTGNDTITETTTGIAAALTVAIADASISEAGGSTTATVTRNSSTSGVLTVSLSSDDTGEATVPASVQIADGQASATFTITAVDDAIYDLTQTVTITASAAGHADGSDTVEIADDEALPALSVADVTVNENAGTAAVTVSIDTESVQDVTVAYATSDGTAVAGGDYTTASGTTTIAAGQTSTTFNVSITDDTTDETDETVTVTLTNPSNATIADATGTLTITDDDDAPSLSIADVTVGEGDGTATLTVSLSAASGQTVSVDYATSDGTATSGSDYTATSGTLTFSAGETSKTFDVTLTDDALIEGSETVTATLSNPTNATLADASGTVTINDNDGALQVSIADVTVGEGDGTATLTVSLNAATGSDVTVDYATSDATATAPGDYAATSGTATITAGQTSTTFTVPLVDDVLDEVDEAFSVTLSNASAGSISDSEAVVTLTDNDDAPALSIADVTVGEGDGTATLTVSLSATSGQTVTVAYATSDGTAVAGSDYTAGTGTATIAAGQTSTTFNVSITDDTTDETDETVTVTLSNPSNATIADATGTLTITDDDDAPSPSIANVTVGEGDGTATLTVSLSAASGQLVSVDYATSDGTATSGSDYTATSGTLTFSAGETTKTFTVSVIDDALIEGSETITATLSNATNATISDATGTVTINDNDGALQVSIADVTVGEGDGTATLTVSLNAATGSDVTVDYATSDATATAPGDYAATSGTATITAGQTSTTFTVPLVDDVLDEVDETLTVTLSNASAGSISDSEAVVAITDNDAAPALSIADVTVGEGDGTATVTVSLSAASGQLVSVDYATSDGTASAPGDYTATSGTLTFSAGETTKTFTVSVTDDAVIEPSETITATISSATNATISDANGTLTINDNDGALQVSIADVTVGEGDGTATLTVSLNAATGSDVTVDYATSDGTATAGSDYTAVSGTATISAGQTSTTFTVSVTDDALDEVDETFSVTLSNASAGSISDSEAVVTITDNDDAPALSIADVTGGEGDATATLTVSLSAASGQTVTVAYATSDGTAVAGSDYTAGTGTATIAAGQTSTTFNVSITDDATDETDETLTVTLSTPSNATIADATGTLTITDDDDAPSLSVADVTVGEGDGTATLTVSLSAASGQLVSVDYATSDGTATSGSDYTATSGTLTFSAGETSKTFDVALTDDAVIEGSETVTATLSNPTNATISDANGTLTINDNDGALQVSIADVTVGEGDGTATLTVSLNAATGSDVTVDYATSDGTATAGSDYTAASGTATITAGQTSTTFSVSVTDDVLDEVDEAFSVTLSNASAGSISDSEAVVTMTDNDAAPALSIADVMVGEGDGTATVTVSLSAASGQAVSVDFATSDGTATAGNDYTATSGTLTFSAGETTKTFDIAVSDDAVIEGSETITATLSNPTNATLADATGTLTITDNDTGGFTLTETAGNTQVSESGTMDTFTAVLDIQPPSDVVLTISSGDTGEATVSPSTLTFSPANWNQPQTVTVTGVDDAVVDGSQTTTVTVAVDDATSDDAFDALADQSVSVITTDDDTVGFTLAESDGSTSVSESGTTDTFTAVLDAQPSNDVVLTVTSGDTGEATVDQSSLTFTPANWNQPQTITVTGVDDAATDGPQATTITVAVDDASSDDNFDALADQTVTVTTTDDDAAGFTLAESDGSTEVSESGTTDAFTAVLTAQPSSDVILTVTSGDTGEATVSPSMLTFTSANWNQPQTVTVTGADDNAADGSQTTSVTVSVNDTASDDVFDNVADQTVSVTTTDDDAAGFTLTESGGSTEVSEAGTTDTFTAVLNVQPASDVVLNVSSGDTGEATVDQTSLTFTPVNWNLAQTVTVTGIDDVAADGDQATSITVSVDDAASDDAFDGVADQTISATTTDDDAVGFTLAETDGSTSVSESGTTDTFTAVLNAQPASDVVLNITSGDTGEATVDQSSLTFTSANWNQPQTITVTGVDDAATDGPQATTITVAVDDASSDDAFDALADQTVSVITTDDDAAGFTVAESDGSTTVSESGTTDAFTVALTAQPATDVVIEVTSGDIGEATVDQAGLTFTSANWNVPQTVTVTGIDDDLADGTQTSTVTLRVADGSSDDAFDALADQTVSVTTTDDDVAGFTVTESGGSTSVAESGTADTFTVLLDAQPSSDVVLNVSSGDTGEATLSASRLTFTPANWNVAQTVTVTGVDDAMADGDQTTTITLAIDDAASDDAFDALADQTVSVTTTDDDAVGFTLAESGGSTQVAETGTTDTFTLVLDVQPTSDVVLNISSGDTGEATVDQSSLTFTSINWNQPQAVTVTGVDDAAADGTQTTTITVAVDDAASDDAFDALADQTVSVATTDDDTVGFTLAETDGSTTVSESGTTDTFTAVLNAQPTSDVVLTVTSGDTGEATVDQSSLTFTPANWNVAQIVTVTGVDDAAADGDQTTSITLSVNDASSDDAFDGVADQTINATTTDDDAVGFTLAESDGSTTVSESGTTDTFTAVLDAQPAGNVVLAIASGDTGEATVDQASLTFTSANWNQPQTVTVTGVDDASADGDQTTTITVAVDDAGSDDAFDALADQAVTVTTTDDDLAGFTLTESGGSTQVSESGTTDTFTAVLTAQPTLDVVLSISSGDTGEATVSPSALTFTSANWNVPQTVTVSGADDNNADGSQTTLVTVSVDDAASDDGYDALPDQTISVITTDDDVTGFTLAESEGSTEVSESGTTDTFTAVLNAQPASDVVLNVTSGDTGEATVDQASLTFTAANWDTPQTITVTGVDDAAADGNQATTITLSVDDASSDDAFDSVADQTVNVTTTDDDAVGFTLAETDGSTSVSESGTTDTFTAVLDAQPASDVVLAIASGDTGEATASPAALTFTPANWNVPQTVTVTGVNDAATDGPQTTIITVAVEDASSDDAFDALADQTVMVTTADDDTAGFTIVETDGSTTVSESGTTDTFSVVLGAQPASDVILTVTSDDTAEATVDQASLTFTPANWNVAQTVTVTGVDDPTVDGSQTSTVTVAVDDAASDDTFDALADQTVTVTTTDDDTAGFTLAESDGSTEVTEGGTTDTFTAVLDAPPIGNVTLAISSGDTGEATVSPSTLTFTSANWNVAQTVTVTGVDDVATDGAQTTTLTVSVDDANSDDAFDALADQAVTVTTTDNDAAGFTLAESDGSTTVSESGTTDTFTAILDAQPASDVVLTITSGDAGEATVSPATLTFTPATWNVAQTVTVAGVADALSDGNQTTTLTIAVDAAASDDAFDAVADQTVTVTVADEDPLPSLSIADVTVDEGDGTAMLTVALSAASGQTVSVDYATADGTAEAGTDYTTTSGTLTFAAGEVTQTFTVALADDAIIEGAETLTATLTNPTNATLADAEATINIDDNDGELQVSIADVTVAEGDGTATLTVSLNGAAGRDVTVDYATADATAAAGSDYTPTTGTVSIPAGQTSATFTVAITDDALDEGDETFTATLSNASSGTISDSEATVTITDNDPAPGVSIADVVVGEGDGTATLTVTLSAVSGQAVTVDYATADGTAAAGSDYTATSGTLTFAAGETTQTFDVTIADDPVIEGGEAFTIALSNPTNATLDDASANVSVDDNDGALQLSIADVTLDEGDGQATLAVSLNAPTSTAVTVDYATADGTAAAGSDYTAATGTLTFAAGQTSQTFAVAVTDDALDEIDEAFTATLSNASSGTISDSEATITVTDNDDPPTVSIVDAVGGEDGGTVEVTIQLSAASSLPVTVEYATADGTAGAGTDYTPTSGTATIAPGETSTAITIALANDNLIEPTEAFSVAIANPVNATLGTATATVTLNDDDGALEVSIANVSVAEGAGAAVLTVALTAPTTQAVTVDYATANGSATAGLDYTASTGIATVPAGATTTTISIPLTDDAIDEPDETFTVQLTNPSLGRIVQGQAVVTIADDDDAPTLSIADAAASEADEAVVLNLTLSAIATQPIEVAYQTQDGTATAGKDYESLSGTLTIPAGALAATLRVPVIDDAVAEDEETFRVLLSAPVNASIERGEAVVTLSDDDARLDLRLTKDDRGAVVAPGQVVVYALAYENAGSVTASGVTVQETVPAQTTFNAAQSSEGWQTTDGIVYTFDLGELAPAATGEVAFAVRVNDTVPADVTAISNTARIGDDGAAGEDALPENNTATDTTPLGAVDFGDAPDSYGTTLAANGARHAIGTLQLGPTVSPESDGTPSTSATGDVDDGVRVQTTLLRLDDRSTQSFIQVESSAAGQVDAWVDFNQNGQFDHPAEHIAGGASQAVSAGANTLSVEIPQGTPSGTTFLRVRLSSAGGLLPTGEAPDGEVEDYALAIADGEEGAPVTIALPPIAPGDDNPQPEVRRDPITGDLQVFLNGLLVYTAPWNSIIELTLDGSEQPDRLVLDFGGFVPIPPGGLFFNGGGPATDPGDELVLTNGTATTIVHTFANASDGQISVDGLDVFYTGLEPILDDLTVANRTFAFSDADDTIVLRDEGTPDNGLSFVDSDHAEEVIFRHPTESLTIRAGEGADDITVGDVDATLAVAIRMEGGAGADRFAIRPSAAVPIVVDGGAPTAEPGDVLQFNLDGVSGAVVTPSGASSGTLTAQNRAAVTYDGIESVEEPVQLNILDGVATEGDLSGTVTVQLSRASTHEVQVAYATADSTATAESDYVATSGTLTFAPGTTEQAIRVELLDDAVAESTEALRVVLSSPQGATLERSAAVLVVTDDEAPLTLAVADAEASEGAGEVAVIVTLSAPSEVPIHVAYATQAGSASESDYVPVEATLTFAPGTTEQAIAVTLVDDEVLEGDEAFVVALRDPQGATLADADAQVTISDDEPDLVITPSPVDVSESAADALVEVRLSSPVAQAVTVAYATVDGTAVAGADYTATNGTLTFAPGTTAQTVSVPILDDATDEADEVFSVRWSAPSQGTLAVAQTEVSIRDDDVPAVIQVAAPVLTEADGEAQITVQLTAASGTRVTVDYATADGTAIAGEDYTATSGTLTFTPGTTEQQVSIPLLDDALIEPDETLVLTFSAPTNATLAASSLTLTLADDEAPLEVSLEVEEVENEEAEEVVVTVRLSGPAGQAVTVDYATADGTASAGADYTATNGTLTFTPGTVEQTVAVPLLGDADDEADETFSIVLSNVSFGTLATPSVDVLLRDDDLPLPTEVIMQSLYPNPARGQATLQFALPEDLEVKIAVYNIQGRLVREVFAGRIEAGYHEQPIMLDDQAAGPYIVRIETPQGQRMRTLINVR